MMKISSGIPQNAECVRNDQVNIPPDIQTFRIWRNSAQKWQPWFGYQIVRNSRNETIIFIIGGSNYYETIHLYNCTKNEIKTLSYVCFIVNYICALWDDVNRLTKSNDNQWKKLVSISDNNDCINKDYLHIPQDLIKDGIKPKCLSVWDLFCAFGNSIPIQNVQDVIISLIYKFLRLTNPFGRVKSFAGIGDKHTRW